MGKHAIHYQGANYGVDIITLGDYQDAVGRIADVESKTIEDIQNEEDWITYHFLMDRGFLVSEPMMPDPNKPQEDGKETKYKGVVTRDYPHPLDVIDVREETWTQARILNERAKLLNERERFLSRKEKELVKIKSTPPTKEDITASNLVLLIVLLCGIGLIMMMCKFA
jgi:hypothetical protein